MVSGKKSMKKSIPKNLNGFLPDEIDHRDYPWELFFGSITLEADKLPEEFSWKEQMPSKLPIQGDEPACCSHCFACYQMFNSLKEGNDIELSPRFLYALTGKPNVGRTFRSQAKTLRDIGDTLENVFPNKTELSHKEYCDPSLITTQMRELAKRYKIKSWTVLNTDLNSIKRAIFRSPVAIAVGGNNKDWGFKNKNSIPFGKEDWYHAILAIGWTKDGKIEIANWWRSLPYGFLKAGYFIRAAYSLEDLPDFPKIEGYVAIKYLKQLEGFKQGTIVAPIYNLRLREEPTTESKKIMTLKIGQKCEVINDEVKLANGYKWQKIKVGVIK